MSPRAFKRPFGVPPLVLPHGIVQRVPRRGVVVEVGVGGRWALLQALGRVRPDLSLVGLDLSARRLGPQPRGIHAIVADACHPPLRRMQLAYADRPPEELQACLARWPCPTLVRPLGPELAPGSWRPVGDGWFLQEAGEAKSDPLHHNP